SLAPKGLRERDKPHVQNNKIQTLLPAGQPITCAHLIDMGSARNASKMSTEEQQLFEIANVIRGYYNHKPLQDHPLLFQVARAEAALMAKQQPLNTKQRLVDVGYYAKYVDEIGISYPLCNYDSLEMALRSPAKDVTIFGPGHAVHDGSRKDIGI